MERRTYTVAETAEILGVSTDVVYRMKMTASSQR